MDDESLAATVQALNAVVLAIVRTHPDGAALAAEIEQMALRWEANAGDSLNSDRVLHEAAEQVRRFALLARNQGS